MAKDFAIENKEQVQRESRPFLEAICGKGISSDPKLWALGDVTFLLQELGTEGRAALTPDMLASVRAKGYNWVEDYLRTVFCDEAVLRMNAYARLYSVNSQIEGLRQKVDRIHTHSYRGL